MTYRLRPNGDPMGLVRSFTALVDDARLDGKPYIRSVKGGKQHSPQSLHAGMQVVFVMEFEVSLTLAESWSELVGATWPLQGTAA